MKWQGSLMAGALCAMAYGAAVAQQTKPSVAPVSLAVTFDAAGANITTSSRFWFSGGAAELNAEFFHGVGVTASVTGLTTSDSGGGVPVNLVVAAFGPSYAVHPRVGRHAATVFAHGLLGEANGFRGVYPAPGAPVPSANSLAALAGGGLDISLSRRIGLRCFEADWLRTALPNSTTNVQNNVRVGAGLVVRFGR